MRNRFAECVHLIARAEVERKRHLTDTERFALISRDLQVVRAAQILIEINARTIAAAQKVEGRLA